VGSVEIVIPVLNEEKALPSCIDTLRAFCAKELSHYRWHILVADNGSTDATLDIARGYSQRHPDEVGYIHLEQRGRGRALKRAWSESPRDILTYMDVDLSTGLDAFPPLVKAIAEDGYHIAIGTRLAKGANIKRSPTREVLSRGYNFIIKAMFLTKFSDAQCGFKAISKPAAEVLLPHMEDNAWFFDTELLIVAEKRGFRIAEVPVKWIEDPDTRVKIRKTVTDDLKGLWRLRRGGLPKVAPPVAEPQRKAA